MQWPWRRRPADRWVCHLAPLPDGDRVLHDDGRDVRQVVADLLAPDYRVVGRAAVPTPAEQVEQVELPLMTLAAQYRAGGFR